MSAQKLFLVWFVLIIVLLVRFVLVFLEEPALAAGDHITFTATLLTEPVITGGTQRFTVVHEKARITVGTQRFPQYHYGDTLTISGILQSWVPENVRPNFRLSFPKIEAEQQSSLAILRRFRRHVLDLMRQKLPAESSALFAGILLGEKGKFSQGFADALRNTGTLHVVAASGMNVSMVASFLLLFFLRFFSQRKAIMFVMVGVLFYAVLASLDPPIVRAAIMGGIAFTALVLRRQAAAAFGLAFACYSMLLFDPFLLFDIGFQLSFAATGGLLFLLPLLKERIGWFGKFSRLPLIGEGASTTIVAQIATLPILLASFGSISILSVLVNTLVLWTVPIIMAIGLAGSLVSFVPVVSSTLFIGTLPLLLVFEYVVGLFNQPALLININIPLLIGAGYYFLLFGAYLFLSKNHSRKANP